MVFLKTLFTFSILTFCLACQNSLPTDPNEICRQNLKKPVKFGLADTTLLDTAAHDVFMLEYSDSWTYSQVAVFEKIDKLMKLKTDFSEREKQLRTERTITDLEWQFVEKTIENANFWCINPDAITPKTIDGGYFKMSGKKGNFKQVLNFDEIRHEWPRFKDTTVDVRLKLQAAARTLFRMSGLNTPHYPFIMYVKKGNTYHFQVASRQMAFKVFLNGKIISLKGGVANIELNKSRLGKDTLRCTQIEFDGQKVYFERVIDDYFLTQLPLK